MINPTVILLVYYLSGNTSVYQNRIVHKIRSPKMNIPMNNPQLNNEHDLQQPPQKGAEVVLQGQPMGEEEMLHIAAAAAAAAQMLPSVYFAKGKEMGEISQKIHGLGEDNSKLREKLKTFKKDNTTMNKKIGNLEDQNHKQQETIRALESSHEKLMKELEIVKKAKERLRVELEEKTSKFSTENQILTEKLDALTKDFEKVENENKELKRALEELASSNNSLKETVDTIKEENQQLKDEMASLKEEHLKINKQLECKETRLALGQVAWMLEAEIWKAVLPDENMGVTRVLKTMEYWLRKNASSADGKAAQKRWDELKIKLKWDDDDHRGALSCLKKLRIVDAHPKNVDLEVARKQLNDGNYVADVEKKPCEEIINMVVIAKTLNNSK